MTPTDILRKYTGDNTGLYDLLYRHSRCVADLALEIVDRHPEWPLDRRFVEEAALLHDIGVVKTDAAGICCYGSEPYIRHGVLGYEILMNEGLPRHALVCKRHTGTGLSVESIASQDLPLPREDMRPVSLEEQIICFADKFYSKTHPDTRRSPEQARRKLEAFGEDSLRCFDNWCESFL